MPDIVTPLVSYAGLIEKGGIVGVMVIFSGLMVYEIIRLRKILTATYKQRDHWRLAYVIVKGAADHAGARYDLSELAKLVGEENT